MLFQHALESLKMTGILLSKRMSKLQGNISNDYIVLKNLDLNYLKICNLLFFLNTVKTQYRILTPFLFLMYKTVLNSPVT